MKSFNVITGMPRSGSTLLCNILNQNPQFYASSTSPLPELFGSHINKISNCAEVQSALINDPEGTTRRVNKMFVEMVNAWYDGHEEHVFDKSRGWSFNTLLLQKLFSNIKIIATVRDLRNVFGSVEKQHRETPAFDLATNPNEKTINARADTMLAPDGFIGQCVVGLEDLIARTPANVFILQYESFTLDPAAKLKEIYNFLELPYFAHDFEDVKSTANDVDALYLNKFPHEGTGKVEPTNRQEWKEYLTPELGNLIYNRYPAYNAAHGY
jgi:sulfotransferase